MKIKKWWIVGFVLLVVGLIWDKEISMFFVGLRGVVLTEFLLGLNLLSSIVIIFFVLTGLFLWYEHKRRWILPLWLGLIFSVAVSFVLKAVVGRVRPFLAEASITALTLKDSYFAWNSSFPSFHAMLVFSALPVLDKEFRDHHP